MKDKKEITYAKVFSILKCEIAKLGLNFSPKSVVSDFELAIQLAAQQILEMHNLSHAAFI